MLPETKLRTLQELVENSTNEELIWINGYLSGLVKHSSLFEAPIKTSINKVSIVYGTDTGNSKKLSSELALKAKRSGVNAKVQSLDQYRLSDLLKEEYLIVIISTHGDGEPRILASNSANLNK